MHVKYQLNQDNRFVKTVKTHTKKMVPCGTQLGNYDVKIIKMTLDKRQTIQSSKANV